MALAILFQEWRQHKTINTYTWIGVGWIVFQQIMHATFINTEMYFDIQAWVGSLAVYR